MKDDLVFRNAHCLLYLHQEGVEVEEVTALSLVRKELQTGSKYEIQTGVIQKTSCRAHQRSPVSAWSGHTLCLTQKTCPSLVWGQLYQQADV